MPPPGMMVDLPLEMAQELGGMAEGEEELSAMEEGEEELPESTSKEIDVTDLDQLLRSERQREKKEKMDIRAVVRCGSYTHLCH